MLERGATRDLRFSKQAALTTAPETPPNGGLVMFPYVAILPQRAESDVSNKHSLNKGEYSYNDYV